MEARPLQPLPLVLRILDHRQVSHLPVRCLLACLPRGQQCRLLRQHLEQARPVRRQLGQVPQRSPQLTQLPQQAQERTISRLAFGLLVLVAHC